MEISSFKQDLIGLENFAAKLEAFIKVEQRFVNDSLVLSLNGSFGSGKTTFLNMWRNRLENGQEKNIEAFVVEVNAWSDDYCGDPLVSLIFEMIESLEHNNHDPSNIKEAAKDIGWFLTGIGSQVVDKFTGINPVAAGELAEKKSDKIKSKNSSIFEIFKSKKEALADLKNSIRSFVEKNKSTILIFVDELDRCRPDYAISYLETIKHVFDIKGLIFILAVDRYQLECSAKAAFGDGLNFPEYYRKFIHREISLPKPSVKSYKEISSSYVDYYLERESERMCIFEFDDNRVDNMVELVSSLRMTPRQIQEIFRIMGHIFETNTEKRGKLYRYIGIGTLLMAVLKVGKQSIYQALGEQKLKIKDTVNLITDLRLKNEDWWFTLIYSGGGLSENDTKDKNLTNIFIEAGLIEEGQQLEEERILNQWYSGWGHSNRNGFKKIYSNIEEITSWN